MWGMRLCRATKIFPDVDLAGLNRRYENPFARSGNRRHLFVIHGCMICMMLNAIVLIAAFRVVAALIC